MKLKKIKNILDSFNKNDIKSLELYEALEASYHALETISDQLKSSDKYYELLLENMTDIVWMTTIDGTITYTNPSFYHVLGYEENEVIGKKLYEFMCPLHKYKMGSCKACVASMSKTEFKKEEMWMVHRDGKTRKVLEVNSNHVFHQGEINQIQSIGRDITERIQIERKIKKKNRYMKFIDEISASINQNVTLSDLDGLLDHTCKKIVTTMNVDFCSLRLIEEKGLVLKGLYGRHKALGSLDVMPFSAYNHHKLIKIKEPFVLEASDAKNFSDEIKNIFMCDSIHKILVVPLIIGKETIGYIAIAINDQYEEDHLSLYTSLGNNIASACEKSRLYQGLKSYYLDIIMTLVAAIEAKDPYTQGHSLRVSDYAYKIAKRMAFDSKDLDEIRIAGILHDVGKIGININILRNPGRLTEEEYEEIKEHPTIGMKILERIDISENTKDAILYHHLRVDLQGYPTHSGLKEQPLFARIIGAADALDAMTSFRTYKDIMDIKSVKEEFIKMSGSQFCPQVVETVVALLDCKDIVPLSAVNTFNI